MLYIFDLDSTLVEMYGTQPLPEVVGRLASLVDQGARLAVATNQAGPAWRQETYESKYPTAESLGKRFRQVAELIPVLARAPWFVAVGDTRLDLNASDYEAIVASLMAAAGALEIHVSAAPEWRKPEPGMLLAACERHGVSPSEAIFVGDAKTDAEAAHAAGMSYIPADRFFDLTSS